MCVDVLVPFMMGLHFWLEIAIIASLFSCEAFRPIGHKMMMMTALPSHIHKDEYQDDDFQHVLGIDDPNHVPSLLQEICSLRLKEVLQSKEEVDVQGCGFDISFFVSKEDLETDIKEFDSIYGSPLDLKERIMSTQSAGVSINIISYKGSSLNEMKRIRVDTQQSCATNGIERPVILQRDFILDKYQILEARSHGADSVLLIVGVCGVEQLKELNAFGIKLDMTPCVQVSSDREIEIALECGARVIGVDDRVNLHTFKRTGVSMTTARVINKIEKEGLGPDVAIFALSDFATAEEVE